MIPLKSEKDLEMLRISGCILAKVIEKLKKEIRLGVRTQDIDKLAEEFVRQENAEPAFLGYKGYPATICASINNEIVHGIPSNRALKNGDLFSLDVGLRYQGYYSDAAITVGIGTIDAQAKKLIEVTKTSLEKGIKQARAGRHLSDISSAVQRHVEASGFSVVRQFVGHGIGKALHEEPEIPNFGRAHEGPVLKTGMVLAIEPMVNAGTWEAEVLDNGWTAVTKDGSLSAHFEHTVAITHNGPEILTTLP
ncbi:MAG: type I methionyl aminopeptidase [Candidatus Omnitrophica bacterium]|nr:type I methionyl aminopeptidase [Candidatus Omnitrophota bacterium]